MTDQPNPVVRRRRLRAELRVARQRVGLTQEEVAEAMDWSPSKVIRIEAGSVGVSTNDLRALLGLYEVSDGGRIDELVGLAREARERVWWSAYRDILAPAYLQFIAFEAAAAVSLGFEPLLVPGLLQTEEYARAVIEQLGDEFLPQRLDALVSVRMKRQELLGRADPPQLVFVLDEAVIRRLVGGAAVMRRQIQHIVELADRPNVTVHVLPFNVGAHRGMKGPFVIFELADAEDDDVLYVEGPMDNYQLIRDRPEELATYTETFTQLKRLSFGQKDSLTYLAKIADELA